MLGMFYGDYFSFFALILLKGLSVILRCWLMRDDEHWGDPADHYIPQYSDLSGIAFCCCTLYPLPGEWRKKNVLHRQQSNDEKMENGCEILSL